MTCKYHFFILCAVLVFTDSAFVDTLKKCSIKDNECLRGTFQSIFKDHAKTGIPEYDIAVFDPITLTNITLPFRNFADATLVEGKVKGLSECTVNEFTANVEKGAATLEITCDLTIKGHYKAFSNNPLIMSTLGGESVRGDGKAKIKIEKLNIKINFYFVVEERDGETYFKRNDGKFGYKYDVLGKLVAVINNLMMGDEDVSARLSNLINQHWKIALKTVGDPIMDIAMEFVKDFLHKFFSNVPTKYFITEDLKPYVSR